MLHTSQEDLLRLQNWESLHSHQQVEAYRCVLNKAEQMDLALAWGGDAAVALYSGKLRKSPKVSMYTLPENAENIRKLLSECGFEDIYSASPYDRQCLCRASLGEAVIECTWSLETGRSDVDVEWITGGAYAILFQHDVHIIPPEELIWSKLYVLQSDRCDWPDIFNVLNELGSDLDWDHLLDRVDTDLPLVKGVLSVFSWIEPERAKQIPHWVWDVLGLSTPVPIEDSPDRLAKSALLDARPWFIGDVPQR